MAKELPYFRFTVQEWQNGDISLESYQLKGFFIDICSYYWIQDCSITYEKMCKKFSNDKALLDELIKLKIIKHFARGLLEIKFLDIQKNELKKSNKKRMEAGRLGGLKKSSNATAMLKQKPSYKDKDKDKKKYTKKKSLFQDSNIFTLEQFTKELRSYSNGKYKRANMVYYHECVGVWAANKEPLRSDWVATAAGFMLRDRKDNKYQTK